MADDDRSATDGLAPALALLAHDLRNPAAAVLANLTFLDAVRETLLPDEREALADALVSVRELLAGIEHLGWVAVSMRGGRVASPVDADVVQALRVFAARTPAARLEVPAGPLRARAASALPRLLELLASNAAQHAPGTPFVVRAAADGEHVVVTVLDEGRPMAPALRPDAFTLRGQDAMKDRPDGRYGRMLGLVGAGLLAEGMGATLAAGDQDGRAAFVVRLRAV